MRGLRAFLFLLLLAPTALAALSDTTTVSASNSVLNETVLVQATVSTTDVISGNLSARVLDGSETVTSSTVAVDLWEETQTYSFTLSMSGKPSKDYLVSVELDVWGEKLYENATFSYAGAAQGFPPEYYYLAVFLFLFNLVMLVVVLKLFFEMRRYLDKKRELALLQAPKKGFSKKKETSPKKGVSLAVSQLTKKSEVRPLLKGEKNKGFFKKKKKYLY